MFEFQSHLGHRKIKGNSKNVLMKFSVRNRFELSFIQRKTILEFETKTHKTACFVKRKWVFMFFFSWELLLDISTKKNRKYDQCLNLTFQKSNTPNVFIFTEIHQMHFTHFGSDLSIFSDVWSCVCTQWFYCNITWNLIW